MRFDQHSPAVAKAGKPAETGRQLLAFAIRSSRLSTSTLFSKPLVLDLIERALILIFFFYFAHRVVPRLTGLIVIEIAHPRLIWLAATTNIQAALLVISESLGVLLILMRRSTTLVSPHPLDWALSFVAVNAPLLATPAAASTLLPSQIPTTLMVSGLIVQISAKAVLWRSYGVVPANRGIKTRGPYGFIRHPIYVGYTLTHIGFMLGFPSLHNFLLYFVAFCVEVARLQREELILQKDALYREYTARVRYRLIPGVF